MVAREVLHIAFFGDVTLHVIEIAIRDINEARIGDPRRSGPYKIIVECHCSFNQAIKAQIAVWAGGRVKFETYNSDSAKAELLEGIEVADITLFKIAQWPWPLVEMNPLFESTATFAIEAESIAITLKDGGKW